MKKLKQEKEKRNVPSKQLQDFIKGIDEDGSLTSSGVKVDEFTAMQMSAVNACVRILSETVASLPLHLYRRNGNGSPEKVEDHPLAECLYSAVNEEMTSFQFRESMMASVLLWGNAYARIIRNKLGQVTELWFLKPQYMVVDRDMHTGEIVYTYTDDTTNETYTYTPKQIFHLRTTPIDGLRGMSPIEQASSAIGLALAAEQYGAKFFGNGANPGGVLEHPGVVKDPTKIRESWNAVYQGSANAHKIAVLEEGMKYKSIGISPNAAQFLKTRKYQVEEICRIFRIPPHMVGDLDRATFSNIEHQSIQFVVHTVRPWLVRWEQAITRCLLNEKERGVYYARFNVDGLLRGDYQSRMEGYGIGRQNGWLSANDIRELEDLPPIPEEQGGNEYFVNSGMMGQSITTAQVKTSKKE